MRALWGTFALAALVLAACNPLARDARADAEVRSVFDQLRRHEDAALIARLDPAIRPGALAQLPAIEGYIPSGEPRARQIVGTSTFAMSGEGETFAATDEYDFGDRKVLVDTRLHRPSGTAAWQVQGFHVQAATTAELAANRFGLVGKSGAQYAFLAFAIASPLLMIGALVKVIRTVGLRRKWLWGILAFVGLCSLRMNWATGQLSFQWFHIQLIGAGVMRGASSFSQWVVSATVPVGAILILSGVWANPRRARKVSITPPGPGPEG